MCFIEHSILDEGEEIHTNVLYHVPNSDAHTHMNIPSCAILHDTQCPNRILDIIIYFYLVYSFIKKNYFILNKNIHTARN